MSRELLVDGDILLHRFGFANETTFDFGEGVTGQAVAPFEIAYRDAQDFLERLKQRNKATDLTLCFSGSKNYRYTVLPSYKWNRKHAPKPLLYVELKEKLLEDYVCLEQDKLEGDDLMGIISTANKGQFVICSIDKDLKQIPGRHYNWNTDKKFTITKKDAEYFFYLQILTGDPGDGYTGIPGIGAKKAEAILVEPYWDSVLAAYLYYGLTEQDALTQARVARILRHGEYDFSTQEVRLWTP